MKIKLAAALFAASVMALNTSCNKGANSSDNPFFEESYGTPYEIPPFEKIKPEHYIPAFEEGIKRHNAEISEIINNQETPNFDNTILALDQAGKMLTKVEMVFFALTESDNDSIMAKIEEEATPLISAHSDEVGMNDSLFARVKAVYDKKESLGLDVAQTRLLDKTYRSFVRSGALLSPAQKDTLKKINLEIANAELKYNQNLLAETNKWQLVVDKKEDLAGLPESNLAVAAEEAEARGLKGKYVLTLHNPCRLPVLSYVDNRDIREKIYKGYTSLAAELNDSIINTILKLRYQKANLLGFKNYAEFATDDVMAKTPKAAEDLLMQIWMPAIAKVKEEVADMQAYADAHGDKITIEPWDYYYYAEKVKKEKFNFSEDEVRPYFQADSVKNGLFYLANKLYGVTFTEMKDAPKYNPEVTVYDMKDANGEHVAVFMTDYYPRAGKRQGAWMSEFKGSSNVNNVVERPIIFNVGNFTRPTADTPSLLTIDEVETAFHEFGHALHGLLSRAKYAGQSGTNVDRDFVEFPSQINEHWAFAPEILKAYAHHYKTGEVIPDSLIEKMSASSKFNQGFATTELCGAALLDLAWHQRVPDTFIKALDFEKQVSDKLGKPREIEYRYRSPYFKHIFGSSGYAAGYYTYLWAQVLDCDGFELFEEKGVLDPETAQSYLHNILEMGDSEDAMTLYKKFRGHEPQVDALLRFRGLK